MIIAVTKTLHLTPYELATALQKAGVIEADLCEVEIKLVVQTEVNKGRTVLITYNNRHKEEVIS